MHQAQPEWEHFVSRGIVASEPHTAIRVNSLKQLLSLDLISLSMMTNEIELFMSCYQVALGKG